MAERTKPTSGTTPRGTAGWVCINKPSTKFKADGEYSIELILPAAQASALQEQFKAEATKAKALFLERESDPKKKAILNKFGLHVPGSDQLDDAGEPTGNVVIKFKQSAVIKPKGKEPFEVKIGMFDAKNRPIPSSVLVGRGSEIKVAYEIIPFKMDATKTVGVTLRLKAVQVLTLVKYVPGGNAEGYGFGEEDGYATEDAPAESAATGDTTAAGDGSEF